MKELIIAIKYLENTSSNNKNNDIIKSGLKAYNRNYFGEEPDFFGIHAYENNTFIGGAITYTANNEMLLDSLWINEDHRKTGIGTSIMSKVFQLAKEKEVKTIFTDTYSFQAEGFYLKQGFQCYGRVDEYLCGHSMIFLKKVL